jgi:N-acetylglucosaminyldiphosphoundecaprenol N-acetyl-beta-D-mannosaminyltransferase
MSSSSPTRFELCGVAVDPLTTDEVVDRISMAVVPPKQALTIFSANVDMLAKAARSESFRSMLNGGDLVLADGMPLLWMARGLGKVLPERVAGSDLVPRLAAEAAKSNWSLYLMGGADGVAERALDRLQKQVGPLRLAGVDAPEKGFDEHPAGLRSSIERVMRSEADIVLVALGAPRQEAWILEARRSYPAVYIAVGGTFDMIAGNRRRAPVWIQKLGMEWAFRMAQEPSRLGRRYLVEDAIVLPTYAKALWRRWRR